MREYLGLDQPLWQQYLRYVGNMLQGDFGTSIVNSQPVLEEFADPVPGDDRAHASRR